MFQNQVPNQNNCNKTRNKDFTFSSAMSYKTELNLLCQKKKIPLPQYNTIFVSGKSHCPLYKSTLIVEGKTFTEFGSNKKDIENKIAYDVLKCFKNNATLMIEQPKIRTCKDLDIRNIDFETMILIDGDNVDPPNIEYQKFDDTIFIIFLAKNSTRLSRSCTIETQNSNCYIIKTKSIAADVTDHLITYHLGMLQTVHENKKYVIVTKDHFGEVVTSFDSNIDHQCDFDFLNN